MGNTVENVSAGKPKVSGAVFRAPKGTPLPASAVAELDGAFASIGYISDDGVTNSKSHDNNEVKAWGGDTVLTLQTAKDDKFKFKMLETTSVTVLKAVHGDGNVSGTLADGITVRENAEEPESASWVIDLILRGGVCKRIVIPDAQVTELEDVVYSDADAIGYGVTLTCFPDSSGNTHYEYIFKTASDDGGNAEEDAGTGDET